MASQMLQDGRLSQAQAPAKYPVPSHCSQINATHMDRHDHAVVCCVCVSVHVLTAALHPKQLLATQRCHMTHACHDSRLCSHALRLGAWCAQLATASVTHTTGRCSSLGLLLLTIGPRRRGWECKALICGTAHCILPRSSATRRIHCHSQGLDGWALGDNCGARTRQQWALGWVKAIEEFPSKHLEQNFACATV